MPAKKPRVSGGTPEVRVEVNFGSPRPGTEASYVVNGTTHHISQHPPSGSGTGNPETSKSYNIPVRLLLQLMDLDDLAPDLKYVDIEEDLVEMGLVGIVEVDEMPLELLATIGCLGKDGASRLQKYAREQLLPLTKNGGGVMDKKEEGGLARGEKNGLARGGKEGDASGSEKNVDKVCGLAGGGKWEARGKQLVKEESKDVVVEWPSDERDPLGEDEIEDDDELPPIEVLEEASDFSENDT